MTVHLDEISSDSVRKSIAFLFSTTELERVISPAANSGVICKTIENHSGQSHRFYAYLIDNKIRIEFLRIFNEIILSNTSIEWFTEFNLHDSLDDPTTIEGFAAPSSIMQPDPNTVVEETNTVRMIFAKSIAAGESLLARIKRIGIYTPHNTGTGFEAEVECKDAATNPP